MSATARAGRAGRDAALVSTWNLASRLTGVLRVLLLGGALGATRLGDTYQASNQVSNVLFELLAAGTLSAILVPGLVTRLAREDVASTRAFAGAVLGRCLLVIGPVTVLGLVAVRPLASLLFSGNDGPSHDAQVRLGAFLLAFVLLQLVFYAWGAVVSAVLHAAGRFGAASLAPVANNLVVSAGLGLFWLRGAQGVALDAADKWLLGLTALGGVVAMTAVPVVAAWRAGLTVVPRFRGDLPGIGRDAVWGSLALVPAQFVAFLSLVVAARVSGGVAAYQIAFVFFLLPHALVGHPTATVLYPRLARAAANGDRAALRNLAGSGLDGIAALLFVAAAIAIPLAPWLVRVVAVGALDQGAGRSLTATALAWLAVGLPAYGAVLLLTRVSYAEMDLRTPAWCALGGAVVAAAVLVGAALADSAGDTVALVAGAHSAMVLLAGAGLAWSLVRAGRLEFHVVRLARYAAGAVVSALTARLVADAMPARESRAGALVTSLLAALVAGGVYVAVVYALGERRLPVLDMDDA